MAAKETGLTGHVMARSSWSQSPHSLSKCAVTKSCSLQAICSPPQFLIPNSSNFLTFHVAILILSWSKSSYPWDPGCCRCGQELQGWERAARGWGEQNAALLGNASLEGAAQVTWKKFCSHFSVEVTEIRLYLVCTHRILGLLLKKLFQLYRSSAQNYTA